MIGRGKVEGGRIVLMEPEMLPEGMRVIILADELPAPTETEDHDEGAEFERLPFFGMWSDREDMQDSAAWVRREREQWQHRTTRPD